MPTEKFWNKAAKIGLALPLVVLLLLLIPIVVVWLVGDFLFRLLVLALVWIFWSMRGMAMLTVYSNSPHWQQYFEEGILPLVSERSHVLNWSERSRWPLSLKSLVFWLFSGRNEFNPMMLAFRPFRRPQALRFYQAFHDARHGKSENLNRLEKELSTWLDQPVHLSHLHPH